MIWELLVVGGFWFWAILIIHAIWLLASTWKEIGWSSSLSLVTFFLLLWLFGNFNVFRWIYLNPITFVGCLGVYLVAGVLWSFGKWYLFVGDVKRAYEEIRTDFKQERHITEDLIPAGHLSRWSETLAKQDTWREYLDHKGYVELFLSVHRYIVRSLQDVIPRTKDYKGTLIFWMSYWPLSLLWAICSDFIERLFRRIYQMFAELYDRISQHIFRNVKNDFVVSEQKVNEQ